MTGVSTLGSAISKINLLNTQSTLLNKLTLQLASGRKTTKFAGLENDILVSQRARADFQTLERYIDNIKGGERRIEQSLLTIEEFQKQAENFSNAMVGLLQESAHQEGEIIYYDDPFTTNINENTQVGMTSAQPDVDLRTLQDFATNLFDLMGDLLNTKETDRYLLGGADTLKQPYTDTGTLDAAMSTLINQWKDETLPPGTNLTSDELF